MNRPLDDRELQEYLDGRLSDERRAAVEARLRADADAARRVGAWREIGDALREDATEPSPGFYSRARARFEASSGRVPRGLRILSWEVAGLAAAVALALALFAPDLVRMRGRQEGASPPAERQRAEAPVRTEAPREKKRSAERPPKGEAQLDSTADAGSGPAPQVGDLVQTAEDVEYAPDPHEATAEARRPAAAVGREESTAPPPAPTPLGKAAPRREAFEGQTDGVERESAGLTGVGKSRHAAAAAAPLDALLPRAVALQPPPGTAPFDGLRVVEDPAEWETWAAAAGERGEPGSHDPAGRLVLVGAVDGLRCAAIEVTTEPGRYVVRLAGGDATVCAIVLPRDGREVVLATER